MRLNLNPTRSTTLPGSKSAWRRVDGGDREASHLDGRGPHDRRLDPRGRPRQPPDPSRGSGWGLHPPRVLRPPDPLRVLVPPPPGARTVRILLHDARRVL